MKQIPIFRKSFVVLCVRNPPRNFDMSCRRTEFFRTQKNGASNCGDFFVTENFTQAESTSHK